MPDGSALTTRLLDATSWPDFAALIEANNGVWGGCWCMGFHVEGFATPPSAAANRAAKEAHVRAGTVHQVLVYDGDVCVGWAQFGPPAELPNIKNRGTYEKDLDRSPDWRIACIFTGSKHRGRESPGPPSGARSPRSRPPGAGWSRRIPSRRRGAGRSGAPTCRPGPSRCTRRSGSSG
jgi:hypothetical protein